MGKITIDSRDIIWSYLGNFLKLSINVILLPIIIRFLSDEELGMWYVFASIGQLIILLDFGFAPALARNISYVWCGSSKLEKTSLQVVTNKETDKEYFNIMLSTCKYIYMAIALIGMLLLMGLGTPYIMSLSNDSNFLLAWVIYTIGATLNILYSYYASFLIGIGAIAENNISGVVAKLIQIVVSVTTLLLGYGLIGVSLAYLLSGVSLRLVSRYYFYNIDAIRSLCSSVRIDDKFSKCWNVFKTVWHNASRDGLVTVSNYLSTQANTLICSSVIGLTSTGAYGLSLQISSIISTISSIPFASVQPAMQEKNVKGEMEGSSKLFSTSMASFMISFITLSILAIILLPVLLWLKPTLQISYIMFAVLLLNMAIYQIFHLSASYISTFNVIPYSKAFIVSSIATVLLSYVTAKYSSWGIWALIISPLVVSLLYNAWKWPHYAIYGVIGTNLCDFIKSGIKDFKTNILLKLRK